LKEPNNRSHPICVRDEPSTKKEHTCESGNFLSGCTRVRVKCMDFFGGGWVGVWGEGELCFLRKGGGKGGGTESSTRR